MVSIVLKMDEDEEGSRPNDGGKDHPEKEFHQFFERDSLFPGPSEGQPKAYDETDGNKDPISIKGDIAKAKKDGMHQFKIRSWK